MWQRFTQGARRAVFHAQEEAQLHGSKYISSEHILLGLLRDTESTASRLLRELGVDAVKASEEAESFFAHQTPWPEGETGFTPKAKRLIGLAYEEARQLDNNYIGTEHLFLALIGEPDGLASNLKTLSGVDVAFARNKVIALPLSTAPRFRSRPDGEQPPADSPFAEDNPVWDRLTGNARLAVFEAQEEAYRHASSYTSTEHLLLGLLKGEGFGARHVMVRLSAKPEALTTEVRSSLPFGPPRECQRPGLGPHIKEVMRLADAEAESSSCARTGTEHLLLGLLRHGEILGSRVLARHTSLESARQIVVSYQEKQPDVT